MKEITTIGLDLAKSIFQVHGADADGGPVVRRKLRRADLSKFFEKLPPCLVGMEACGSAHHWARVIARLGHEVRLIPPAYVKPFVKRGKTDAADAEAICEAVGRPTMRFVAVKTEAQQAAAMVLKTRELLIGQRTRTTNALRAHLAELGIVAAGAAKGLADLVAVVRGQDERLPAPAGFALSILVDEIEALDRRIEEIDRRIVAITKSDEAARRLMSIPGIGVIIAATIRARVPDPSVFRSGRHFAAWLGLTPKPHSSGGKERLGGISKMGDAGLRSLLVVGATAVMRHAERDEGTPAWLTALMGRRPFKVAAVALANKMARVVWAVLTKGGVYRRPDAPLPG
jgi:transposase